MSDCGDFDVTGDPQLDQFGYQSPKRDFTPPSTPPVDFLAQAKRDRAARQARRRGRSDRRAGGRAWRPGAGGWRRRSGGSTARYATAVSPR